MEKIFYIEHISDDLQFDSPLDSYDADEVKYLPQIGHKITYFDKIDNILSIYEVTDIMHNQSSKEIYVIVKEVLTKKI